MYNTSTVSTVSVEVVNKIKFEFSKKKEIFAFFFEMWQADEWKLSYFEFSITSRIHRQTTVSLTLK